MKRKFVKVMFFGALALSTVTYVGCKDYDDDIDNLQTQIDANKASIADLQKFVNEGKWVKSVEDVAGGFKITFDDGKSYSIINGTNGTNGKDGVDGTNGTDGKNGTKVTIGANNNWFFDGIDSGQSAVGPKGDKGDDGKDGEDGKDGVNGKSPRISATTGCWEVYNTETGAWESTDIVANATIYITEVAGNPLIWELHVRELKSDGTYAESSVTLPKAGSIVSMDAVSVDANAKLTLGSTITLFCGKTTGKVDFNGHKYAENEVLVASGSSKIQALINPADVNVQLYNIGLTDSKDNQFFQILKGSIQENMTEKPLSRAAGDKTANKGVYDMNVTFNKDADNFDLANIPTKGSYALTTRDPFGNEIISKYDVTINVDQSAPTLSDATAEAIINTACDLNALMPGTDKVVDCKYSLALTSDPGELKAENITLSGSTITAKSAGTATIKVEYLKTNGEVVKEAAAPTLKITFKYYADPVVLGTMKWTVNADAAKNTADIALTDEVKALFNQAGYSLDANPTIGFKNDVVKVNGTNVTYDSQSITLALVDKNAGVSGATTKDWVIRATFKPASVCATTHAVSVNVNNANGSSALGNEVAKVLNFEIVVNPFEGFKWDGRRLAGYFDGNKGTATGVISGTDVNQKVTYNLYGLYSAETKSDAASYIKFDEEKPLPEGFTSWFANGGSKTTGDIVVAKAPAKGGVGVARTIKAIYSPFNNSRLENITDEISLTVVSGLGTLKYSGASKEIKNESGTTIEAKEFKIADVANGKDLALKDAKVTLVWTGDKNAQDYLDMSTLTSWDGEKALTVKKKTSAQIVTAQTCKLTLTATDEWGVTHATTVTIVVNKFE